MSSTSSDEEEERKVRKRLKKLKKSIKKQEKREKKKHKKAKKSKNRDSKCERSGEIDIGPALPDNVPTGENICEGNSKTMVPMTKEEWEKKQSVVKRVYDPETGRNRLVKGDGEIIEEIVSYSRHKEINKQATKGDSEYFQQKMGLDKMK